MADWNIYDTKLFAFIVCCKYYRGNSCIYSYDSLSQISACLKINRNTAAKYKRDCVSRGLLLKKGGHFQFKSISSCADILFGDRKITRHIELLPDTDIIFKNVYDFIEFGFAKKNFQQQRYSIELKEKLSNFFENGIRFKGDTRMVKIFCKKNGTTPEGLRKSISNLKVKSIVSGKKHTAGICGFSFSTAGRRFDQWASKKWLYREVKMKFIHREVNHYSFLSLKRLYKGMIIPRRGGFIVFMGSLISLIRD